MLMFTRQSFILLFLILQLFAPLVHGHTGEVRFHQGFHIPGFESYSATEGNPVLQKVNQLSNPEGLEVLVAAGIKNPLDIRVINPDIDFAWLPAPPHSKRLLLGGAHFVSLETNQPDCLEYHAAYPPRAPPIL